MKKYIITAVVLLGSSSAAFAAAPDQVASLAMSCCVKDEPTPMVAKVTPLSVE